MNLLIIEDDEICNFVHTKVAKTSGLFKEIRSAHNGQEALGIFRRAATGEIEAPELVLLDLNMPVMNGFDFIRAFNEISFPRKERVTIVIVTSSDNSIDIERARAMGIDHYLVKSVTMKDLQTTMFALYNKAMKNFPADGRRFASADCN